MNDCNNNGQCIHGWCKCDKNWHGTDCSAYNTTTISTSLQRAPFQPDGKVLTGPEPVHLIDSEIKSMKQSIYVYDLPYDVNRYSEIWMAEQWGKDAFIKCAPVHERRIYSAQAHFESRLFRDKFVRTSRPEDAKYFYVPTFILQRFTWASKLQKPLKKILHHIQHAYPYWNRSGGYDHIWFVSGERSTCEVPYAIKSKSMVIGIWGDEDCMDSKKDVVVPPLSPLQHDISKYSKLKERIVQKNNVTRKWPLIFFAGGIFSFGASQDNKRKTGKDSTAMTRKWFSRAATFDCADANSSCRNIYSMGVRQSLYRYGVHEDPRVRIVSAGVPDYVDAVRTSRFCLHTEGNGWGTRIVDYALLECVPLIVNDRILLPFHDVIPYKTLSLHLSKRDVPRIVNITDHISDTTLETMRMRLQDYKSAFLWWSDIGRAYEYTLASISKKIIKQSHLNF